ncbi:SusD-like starch-binding protein associating with outer membrane [Mucilaginibacter gracilis]|uniref:SusD-like starch-binding protein associating with outer membrane n=1 Tax=Mucilaginibacter gracilis TaxID=423350 RepID=A0A495J502_9SPHI|nr:RagB/SusD family nutrient uptake outer membrane protein [Mucilaginibacter gracilis]RKR83692.1 SusD-like starch-binding protein associating with outer membrane [Mucilaginibacter gracilis]
MKKTIFTLAVLILMSSCRKYVEITQPGIRTLTYTTDYRYLLDNANVFEGSYGYPIISGDDTEYSDVNQQNNINSIWGAVYTWADTYISETVSDTDWDKLYNIIYNCNTVIDGVLTSKNGSDALKQQLYAEALVHRANCYLILVNIYGKQYNATTAATDLGVPLLTTPNLYASLKRASVNTVYAQILTDLVTSVSRLPKLPDANIRPSKAASYALLSKTYLNMRDFTRAGLYADSTLSIQSTLLDLKAYSASSGSAIPKRIADPEVILSKIVNGYYTGIPISADALNLLGTSDLRYVFFTNAGNSGGFNPKFTGRGYWRYQLSGENIIQTGPSVPEVMLTKAECLARQGDATGAMLIVNSLRKKRFLDADYVDLPTTDAATALSTVIDERKREFVGRGYRWFDQKRMNYDAAFALTKTRVLKGVTYTLAPNSNRYLYPIGQKYILLNPELEQNPR